MLNTDAIASFNSESRFRLDTFRGTIPDLKAVLLSLERDVFPSLLERGVYAREQRGIFIDIGTPADYARAQQLSDFLKAAATTLDSPTLRQETDNRFSNFDKELK